MNRRVHFLIFLAASVLLIRGILFYESIAKNYVPEWEIGIVSDVQNGHLYAKSILKNRYTGRQTAGFAAGLRPGDEIVAIYNSEGAGKEIRSFYDLGEVWTTVEYGKPWSMKVIRNGQELTLDAPAFQEPVKDFRYWFVRVMLIFGLPLLILTTAFFLGFAKPQDDNAFLAALFFVSFSFVFGAPFHHFSQVVRNFAVFVGVTAVSFSAYLFARFFLLFPARSILERKFPWLPKALLGFTFIFWILNMVLTFAFYNSFLHYERLMRYVRPITPALGAIQVSIVAVGLISLIFHFLKAETKDERRKTGILLAGAIIGTVPLALFLSFYSPNSAAIPPMWAIVCLSFSISFFPLSFIYVVLRHRVLGIRLILRRGLQYALVSRAFFVVEGLVIFTIVYLTLALLSGVKYTNMKIAGIFLIAIVGAVGMRRVNQTAMSIIDRRFFRLAYNSQQVLTELARGVRRLAAQREKLFDVITDKVSDALLADKVGVFLRDGNPGSFRCHGLRARSGYDDEVWSAERSEDTLHADSLIARQLMRFQSEEPECLEVFVNDPKSWAFALAKVDPADQQYQEKVLIEKMNTKLIVPLIAGEQILGFLSLGEKLSEEAYSKEDKQLLLSVAEQMAIALEYSNLISQVAEQEKLKRELQIATEVQARLFPQTFPVMERLEYTGYCKAARAVGGDYYDFLPLGEGLLGLALGDVSGKGISSALLMANLQALLRSGASLRRENVDQLMNDINRLLCASTTTHKYATLFYCVFDDLNRTLTYVNAGHNPPIVFRADGSLVRLVTGGLVVGMLPDVVYEREKIQLAGGDILLIYSDGLSEAMDLQENEFGEERLIQAIQDTRDQSIPFIQERILTEVHGFVGEAPQHDDLTFVIARVS